MSSVVRSSELARNEGRNEPITYRGSDIEELLPRIRAELGADAIVIRQREGLDGGLAGFFQKRCVEVVARRATAGLDSYDGEAAVAAPEPPAPAIAEIMRVASPFIEQLQAAQGAAVAREREPEPVARAEEQPLGGAFGAGAYTVTAGGAMLALGPEMQEPAPALALVPDAEPAHAAPVAVVDPLDEPRARPQRTGAAAAHERTLVAAGIAPELAAELVGATISHVLPFAPRRTLKRLVREALARRIPLAPPVAAGGRAIAFVGAGGSGKTLSAARLAAAFAAGSDLGVDVLSLCAPEHATALRDLLAPAALDVLDGRATAIHVSAGERVLTVIDTPAVSPAAAADVRKLAAQLRRLGAPEVHVAVPATLSGTAVRALLDGYAALKPAAIVLTHLDEVGHAGPVVDEAIARGIAISYTSDGSAADGFGPADPAALAARVLA